MKFPVFGRRPAPARPTSPSALSGHGAVLDHLRRVETEQPFARPSLVGRLLFDMTRKMIATDRGARLEDLLAILASTGGFVR
ncbi:hypothetical protein [Taklimakanibacter deserti]|uniref:hypothetical protein n=1 Tax=Taklimakanibacter deserti TaxID=2267839 RepID=UPI0013C43CEC